MRNSRLVVVSNRLPVSIRVCGETLTVERSSGGLVSALEPVLNTADTCWIGWPGVELTPEVSQALSAQYDSALRLIPVSISEQEKSDYYNGCSNEIFWPLFHGFTSNCRFDPAYWECYLQINERFADAVETTATPRDLVWVHDYHLMTLASALRDRFSRLRLGYFHHIPFPDAETFGRLPWRTEVLAGLLHYNVVGFQTPQDRRNFIAALRRWWPDPIKVRRLNHAYLIETGAKCCIVGTHPISVDFEQFNSTSQKFDVRTGVCELRNQLRGQTLVLGVDRLDYTKGIEERLAAFELFLDRNPEQRGKVALVQVVVPSRDDLPAYQDLRHQLERSVSRINGRFGRPGWTPVQYLYRSIPQSELIALYCAADIALVTPLKDGMNLVAKEYCASRSDEGGVLILSEFAGASQELRMGAIVVNPHDLLQTVAAIESAMRMPVELVKSRMRHMRAQIKTHDVWRWFFTFCASNSTKPGVGIESTQHILPMPLFSYSDRPHIVDGLANTPRTTILSA